MRIEKKVEKTVTEAEYLCDKCGEPIGSESCYIRVFGFSGHAMYDLQREYHRECRKKVLEDIGVRTWCPTVSPCIDWEKEIVTKKEPCASCGRSIRRQWNLYPFGYDHTGHLNVCDECMERIWPMTRDESKLPKEVDE